MLFRSPRNQIDFNEIGEKSPGMYVFINNTWELVKPYVSLHDVVDKLSEEFDISTSKYANGTDVLMVGNDSIFIKSICNKADKIGNIFYFKVEPKFCEDYDQNIPIIIDVESVPAIPLMSNQSDIDCISHDGISCCAEAISLLFKEVDYLHGTNVTIIGNGHAVKGLHNILTNDCDCTITICHSKTKDLHQMTEHADVIIVAAPILPKDVTLSNNPYIIDVSHTFKSFSGSDNYVGNIGKLTTSIILNRAVKSNK